MCVCVCVCVCVCFKKANIVLYFDLCKLYHNQVNSWHVETKITDRNNYVWEFNLPWLDIGDCNRALCVRWSGCRCGSMRGGRQNVVDWKAVVRSTASNMPNVLKKENIDLKLECYSWQKYRIFQFLKELRNYNRKLIVSTTKIGENTTRILNHHFSR